MKYLNRLPEPNELKQRLKISHDMFHKKELRDQEIADILRGVSKKKIIIIGPCSSDNESSILDYVSRLAIIQESVKDKLLIIPRVYTAKPRTKGCGYMGMLHQPDKSSNEDVVKGIEQVRKIHIKVFNESELSTADEILYPDVYEYISDLLTYCSIGARTVESQEHRLLASGISCPVGMKNPTSGDLSVMLNAIFASQMPHRMLYMGWEVQTDGNPLSHAILRGSSLFGIEKQNCTISEFNYLRKHYKTPVFQVPSVIVDVSHSNALGNYNNQIYNCYNLIKLCNLYGWVNRMIKGLMIESYIEDGRQNVNGCCYGKSITDPCIGWKKTYDLLMKIANDWNII
ncbi:3-deoxy-7-phosphoheptulonate synthase [Ruminococcus sp. YE282]|uniref:3-deoxy-7-phosphoheptulonate synthase n=1 Tax=Ruminococcus sp. YE282 TaxID=3158780 RepID=UPI001A9A4916